MPRWTLRRMARIVSMACVIWFRSASPSWPGVGFGPAGELAQPGDLLLRRHRLGPGPLLEVAGGTDAFAGVRSRVWR